MPATVRGILRVASVILFFSSLAWCVWSFGFEPFLILISTASGLLATFSAGKSTLREVLLSFAVVVGHVMFYLALSLPVGMLVCGMFAWQSWYALAALPCLGGIVGLFHGCLRSLTNPKLRFDAVMEAMAWPAMIGTLFGLVFAMSDEMSFLGPVVLRLIILPLALLILGAGAGFLRALVFSYLEEGEEEAKKSSRPTPRLQRTAGAEH